MEKKRTKNYLAPEDLSMFEGDLQLITADMNVQAACYIAILSLKGASKKMEGNICSNTAYIHIAIRSSKTGVAEYEAGHDWQTMAYQGH